MTGAEMLDHSTVVTEPGVSSTLSPQDFVSTPGLESSETPSAIGCQRPLALSSNSHIFMGFVVLWFTSVDAPVITLKKWMKVYRNTLLKSTVHFVEVGGL